MRQFNTMDSLFLYMDQRGSGMHGTMMQVFSSADDVDVNERYAKLEARINAALPSIPLLHEKIFRLPGDADRPYWVVEKEVDMDYHMHHISLPPPGNWDQLTDVYGQISATPMDLDCPLWEVHVVEGLNAIEGLNKNSFAVITKMHHAGADGITATKVTSIIAGAPIPDPVSPSDKQLGLINVVGNSISNHVNSSYRLGRELLGNLPGLGGMAIKLLKKATSGKTGLSTPATRFNTEISPDRVFGNVKFTLEQLKSLKNAIPEATINDVVLAICGGALRTYLQANDELPESSLVALMPINLRGEEEGGNQFMVARVSLHTDIDSPLDRIARVHRDATKSKQEIKSIGSKKISELSSIIPAPLLAMLLRNTARYGLAAKVPPLANCLITNVPGPQQPIVFDGNELTFMNGSPPIVDGMGLIIAVLSYNGETVFSISSCRRMMPDKALFERSLRDAYDKLEQSVKELNKPPQKSKSKKPDRPTTKSPAAKKQSATRRTTTATKKASTKKTAAEKPTIVKTPAKAKKPATAKKPRARKTAQKSSEAKPTTE